jgi:hypothetical protein
LKHLTESGELDRWVVSMSVVVLSGPYFFLNLVFNSMLVVRFHILLSINI